jgi:antitoxin component YwqK of YwqJK toxin-antitoxin module
MINQIIHFLTSTCSAKIFSICALSFLTLTPTVLYSQKTNNSPLPFNQAAVKQSTKPSLQGSDASKPYFTVRFGLPVPPSDDERQTGVLVGIDADVHDYNHSPAFEIMPNGDVLMIPYSGLAHREGGKYLHLVQARLRYGAEEFDMPEVITVGGVKMQDLKTSDGELALHGPPLMWTEGNTVWLFTGYHWGWGKQYPYPFRVFKSTDNGASWTIVAFEPKFYDKNGLEVGKGGILDSDPQPITNAFRAPNGDMFVACDGKLGAKMSMLWRSSDNGLTWHDQGGRTSTRHTTIVPVDETGRLLALGGKDTSWDPVKKAVVIDGSVKEGGYMPRNISTDWGKTWGPPTPSPFPWLGANQRPSAIRLANGHLVMVGDSRYTRTPQIPAGWSHGDKPYVALSTDDGQTWTIKELPVALKHVKYGHKTLGYTTVRQAPNGVIHVLATRTHPNLHYEFNEEWITSPSAGDIVPETTGGKVKKYKEKYADGKIKATWSARITPNGRYLLDGTEINYYPDGTKQREVTWVNGRRNGGETLRAQDGTLIWSWNHDLANNVSTWTRWWPNGKKHIESQWNTNPTARDLPERHFRGLVANGTARHYDESGKEIGIYIFQDGVRTSPRGNYTESFAADPAGSGWTGKGNMDEGNNFGWSSTTSWCENVNAKWYGSKGEIGGVIARSKEYRWFADNKIGTKDRTQTLHITGKWDMRNTNYEGTFRIGYFNAENPENNFMGIEIREPAGVVLNPDIQYSGKLFRAYLTVKGAGGTTSTLPIEPHNVEAGMFDLIWKGNPDGSGTLSGTLTGLPISITVAAGSSNYNAFGLLTGGDGSNDPTKLTGNCWFDNLNYDK